jgi:phospholipase D1/2
VYKGCTIQALRSSTQWSLGLLKTENSIYDGYIQLIEESKHFIFIENQFFITQCVKKENDKTNVV